MDTINIDLVNSWLPFDSPDLYSGIACFGTPQVVCISRITLLFHSFFGEKLGGDGRHPKLATSRTTVTQDYTSKKGDIFLKFLY